MVAPYDEAGLVFAEEKHGFFAVSDYSAAEHVISDSQFVHGGKFLQEQPVRGFSSHHNLDVHCLF